MDNTYGLITSEELVHDITHEQDTRSVEVSFATRTTEKSTILCIVCYKSGHLALDCSQVIGFPIWREKKKNGPHNLNSG